MLLPQFGCLSVTSLWQRLVKRGRLVRNSARRSRRKESRSVSPGGWAEVLETRMVLTDFGDAPLPYSTTTAEDGARHTETGLMLGANRDGEADGAHSATANADDTTGSPDDEDGVTFGTITVGALGATATVNAQGITTTGKLDAWIDFNGDGSWGGPLEQIANNVTVVNGNNTITFDVPSEAKDGMTFARFRLSTAGNLGLEGAAADGEVEDYAVTIAPPAAASGVFGGQNVVTTEVIDAYSTFAADVDGDGDMDILSASRDDDKIAWYENDGNQNFTAHNVNTPDPDVPFSGGNGDANGARCVFAADMDGDGDLDVLSASRYDDKIAWYENDGTPAVGGWTARNVNTPDPDAPNGSGSGGGGPLQGNANDPFSVFAADVDGDGDLDVLSASRVDDKIAWYENDGNQNFTAREISTAADGAVSVFAADVDGDGDLDVLSASNFDDKIAWYENDGTPAVGGWTARNVNTPDPDGIGASQGNANGAQCVFAADVDGDGDMDVLSASYADDKIAWYENNGSQNFTAHTISAAVVVAWSVTAADVDGDGDMDVLGVAVSGSGTEWYENDGNQNFTVHTIFPEAGTSVIAADVDGDGDLDVVTSALGNKISWYENLDSDYGDAPTSFPTTKAENGARHRIFGNVGPRLGINRDFEATGTHSATAATDDTTGSPDDEDGVTFGKIQAGALGAMVTVNVQGVAGKLDAWLDFNADGSWDDPGEQVFASQAVAIGDNNLTFSVPVNAVIGTTFARFRLSTAGALNVTGAATDGEVEDYRVTVTVANRSPTATAAASPNPTSSTTTNLSVVGADLDTGEPSLTYTWVTTGTPPAAVTFGTNGSNAAKMSIATFTKTGLYHFLVTATDPGGLTGTSTVDVTVDQSLTTIVVNPNPVSLNARAMQTFTGTANDQFGSPLIVQPTLNWSSNVGTITAAGVLTAQQTSGVGTVTASSGETSGTAAVTVTNHSPTATAAASPNSTSGTTTNLSVVGADIDTGEPSLTYTWVTTGTPPAAVTFDTNGSNAAKMTTATFTTTGLYHFLVTTTDPGGLTGTSTIDVTVDQSLTTIVVNPNPASMRVGAMKTFLGTANDQFGSPLTTQPPLTWTTNVGTINSAGVLTAQPTPGVGTVTARNGEISGSAAVTVVVAASQQRLAFGADVGRTSQPVVRVYDEDAFQGSGTPEPLFQIEATATYGVNYRGGVRVAVGDINHDGIDDIVTVPGRNKAPDIKIFSGVDGSLLGTIAAARTYGANYKSGVYVAVGDVTGDGIADIVVSQELGNPIVKVFCNLDADTGVAFSEYSSTRVFADFKKFIGGATVAVGDVSGSTNAEIIVGSGPGMTTVVRVFSVTATSATAGTLTGIRDIAPPAQFGKRFNHGVYVSVGDVVGTDGKLEILTGSGSGPLTTGAGSTVRVYNGATGALLNSFQAFGTLTTVSNSPVRLAVRSGQIYAVQSQDGRSQYEVRRFNLSVQDGFFSVAATDPTFFGGGLFIG